MKLWKIKQAVTDIVLKLLDNGIVVGVVLFLIIAATVALCGFRLAMFLRFFNFLGR